MKGSRDQLSIKKKTSQKRKKSLISEAVRKQLKSFIEKMIRLSI